MPAQPFSATQTTRSTGPYAALEERILVRDQVGASEVFYDLAHAGRPLDPSAPTVATDNLRKPEFSAADPLPRR